MIEHIKRESYPTDLSDTEWEKVEPHIPKSKTKLGRKREHSFRESITTSAFGVVTELGTHEHCFAD
jgi:transposase